MSQMTPDEASKIIRSIEDRAIEHTLLLQRISRHTRALCSLGAIIAFLLFMLVLKFL